MPRVKAAGVELYYEALGEGTPMVLQAHDHTPWLFGQAPVFSQGYRFLTYDRRGTGRSSSPSGDWSAADLSDDLAGLLDALEIEKAIVGGSSLGGVVTAQFAVDHPGRALALVIGHTVPYVDAEGRAWLEEEIVTARAGRPPIVRQPRFGPDEEEGPLTTDPEFAASAWGKMMAAAGTVWVDNRGDDDRGTRRSRSPRHHARVPRVAAGSRVPDDPEQPRSGGGGEAGRADRLRGHGPRSPLVGSV